MRNDWTRRRFLNTGAAASAAAWGLSAWPVARAADDEPQLSADAVRFRPEIEPIVRWMEETSREKIVDKALEQIQAGLSYRDMMAGVFLAAIRNIKPRPVGFKFHAVMAVHSAHLLAQAARQGDRLLPLFWALDNFKNSQAQDVKEGDWTLAKVDEARVPKPDKARATFVEAMDTWDSDKADVATAALCRSSGAAEAMELFFRYGLRDQRNIGHKPIFAVQCWRTLNTIGWQHAEPVLRSLAFGLLDRQGDAEAKPVGPYTANLENAREFRAGWSVGNLDSAATNNMLATLREADSEGVGRAVVEAINREVAPQSIWDAVALAAGEMLMRDPGIVALHAMTSANALHYIFTVSSDDTNRRLALLQAASWMPLYRQRVRDNNAIRIDTFEPRKPDSDGVDEIFGLVERDRAKAAATVVGYAQAGHSLGPVFDRARRMIFLKGRDSHQYKYGGALWEECILASDPRWQPLLAAAGMFYLPGTDASDIPFIVEARQTLARA